jgi:hypothetical protein
LISSIETGTRGKTSDAAQFYHRCQEERRHRWEEIVGQARASVSNR